MRPKAVLFLGLLLLVPVLAFLFLKGFGINQYALPTFLPERIDSTQVGGKWQRDTIYHQLRNFRLVAQTGHPVTAQALANGLYVTSFLCAGCPGASPMPTAQLMRVQEAYRQDARVKLATFLTSAAPTPEQAAEQYGAIAGKWWFLAGAPTVLRQVAADYRIAPVGSTIQSPTLFLVDRDRRVRGTYDGTKMKEIDRLLTEISVLLYMYEHDHSRR